MNVKPLSEIKSLLEEIAKDMQIEVVDVEFKQGKSPALTVYIQTEAGVDLDTCERYHRAIDLPLDELDPTFGAPYTLNVSSPGLDRAFKDDRDFERALGKKVEVKLYAPLKGKKLFEGTLQAFDDNTVTVLVKDKTESEEVKFMRNQVAKINYAIEII